jgi:hypothetical protein
MAPTITVVTCIEAGHLETEVVTMVGSLRRWGGSLAGAPVIAVTPRLGAPLASTTRRSLRDLDVQHVVSLQPNAYPWNGFMNKPLTLRVAAPLIRTTHALWLDGDVLVMAEPSELCGRPGERFMACVEPIGPNSDGPGNRFDPFWVAIAGTLGWPEEEAPWVTDPFTGRKIRAHCNSGVFRYRAGCGLESAYENAFRTLLDSRLVPRDDPSYFLHEQIALGQVAAKDFAFYELPPEYNFHVGGDGYERLYPRSAFGATVLVHYHRALREPATRDRLLQWLDECRPEVAEYLRRSPVGTDPRSLLARLPGGLLRRARSRTERRFAAGCIKV